MKIILSFAILFAYHHAWAQPNLHSDTTYFDNGMVREILTYRKKKVINHIAFDQDGELIYQSPLLPTQKDPAFKFISGRTYFDAERSDTLVFNNNIPHLNLHVYFPGATISQTGYYAYAIKSWTPQPGTQKGKMVIDIYENAFFKSKLVLHKMVLIEIK